MMTEPTRVLDKLLEMSLHAESEQGLVEGKAKRGVDNCVKGGVLEGALAAIEALECLAEDVGWGSKVKAHLLREVTGSEFKMERVAALQVSEP